MLGKKRSYFKPVKCLRCDEFVSTLNAQNLHYFLRYRSERKTTGFEDRPLNTYTIGSINVFEINVQEHSRYYNFEEPGGVVSNFLSNFRSKFVPIEEEVVVKCVVFMWKISSLLLTAGEVQLLIKGIALLTLRETFILTTIYFKV